MTASSMTTPGSDNRLAVQMYTLRRLATPLATLLGQIAAAGYAGIETFGPLEPPADVLRPQLEAAGLQVVSAHVGLDALTNDLQAVIAFHQALGNRTLIVPWLAPEARPTDGPGWSAFGAALAPLGERVQAAGMRLLYHNHDFEMATWDGRTALEWLLAGADAVAPGLLGAEVDLAWAVRGGVDPVALLDRLAGRVPRVHAKDVAPTGTNEAEQGHADVGYGTVDWATLLLAARTAGVEWLVVEHDEPSDPLRSIQRSAAFLAGRW
ncbi:MAG: sugar phosphate isomerase/epimerase family protein [Caldilineaceae bacterium]